MVRPGAETDPGPFHLGHRLSLEGYRGVVILLVLAVHTTYVLVPEWTGLYTPGGFIGVDGFFVLSGFLITSLLLTEHRRAGTISLRSFYRRRALRLFPALWVVMAAQVLYFLTITHGSRRAEVKGLAAVFVFVGNFSWSFNAVIPAQLGPTWSLAVEEQFYLVWPILLLALLRFRRRGVVVAVLVGLILVAFFSRLILWRVGISWNEVYVQSETRLDTLALGALLAYLLHTGGRVPRRIGPVAVVALCGLAAVVVTANRTSAWMFEGGYTLVALAFAAVLLAALDPRSMIARSLAVRPLRALGRISYSLYLWHFLVFMAVERELGGRPALVRLATGLLVATVAASISYRFIEVPFLRRKTPRSADGGGDLRPSFTTPDPVPPAAS